MRPDQILDLVITGSALLLGLLLVTAGVPKVVAPRYAGSAMRRVVRRAVVPSDTLVLAAARALGVWEIGLGAALVIGVWAVPVAVATVVTFAGFLGFVIAAVRRGSSCGCWASLTEGPAGGAEIVRTAALAAIAVLVAAGRIAGDTGDLGWPAVGWAAGGLAVTFASAELGGRIAPARGERVLRQLRYQRPRTLLGRGWVRLTFHAGFVHAGTDADRRRYALARNAPGRLRRRTEPMRKDRHGGRTGPDPRAELRVGAVLAADAQPSLPAERGSGER